MKCSKADGETPLKVRGVFQFLNKQLFMKTMQKLVLIFVFCFATDMAFAQSSNIRKAEAAKEKGNVEEALQLIEEATKHDKTKDDPKTWFTKGTIHEAMVFDEEGKVKDESQIKNAVDAFEKAKSMDKENGTYAIFSDQRLEAMWGQFINKGAEAYQAQDYPKAAETFAIASELKPQDTTAYLYGGIAAQQAEMWDDALASYYKLMDLGYDKIDVYNSAIYVERAINKDDAKALEVVQRARKLFPDDSNLMKDEINLLIAADRADEARQKLEAAIAAEPDNANLYYNLAFLNDEVGEKEKAIEQYKKAVEIDPQYFEANFNIAVIHYNTAAEMIKEANDMDLKTYQKQGKAIEEKAAVEFKKALPYLEKSHELKPDDETVLQTLQTVYSQLKMNEKVVETSEKLQALTGVEE